MFRKPSLTCGPSNWRFEVQNEICQVQILMYKLWWLNILNVWREWDRAGNDREKSIIRKDDLQEAAQPSFITTTLVVQVTRTYWHEVYPCLFKRLYFFVNILFKVHKRSWTSVMLYDLWLGLWVWLFYKINYSIVQCLCWIWWLRKMTIPLPAQSSPGYLTRRWLRF